jgi:type II secretion system protein J
MKKRRAFTLIEISAAIAITGMVALISYGTFRAALDTGARSDQLRERVESASLMEQLLSAASRHAVEIVIPGHPAFELTHGVAVSGQPSDHLAFLSRGILAPLGASGLWAVDLRLVPDGLRFTAGPVDGATSGAVATTLRGVAGLRLLAMSSAPDGKWTESWTSRQPLPTALMVELLSADGTPAFSPMLLRIEAGDILR